MSSPNNPTLRERNSLPINKDWEWYQKFCGIEMSSNYYTYHIFSTIMDENPQIKRIIEFGTYTGSMSLVLGLEGIRKGIDVLTFDIATQLTSEIRKILNKLDVQINICDIFERHHNIKKMFDCPVYLLCDNGNKKNEFLTFVPHLKTGSIISVHDYEVEFMTEDIKPFNNLIQPFHPEQWQKHNVQLATWIVK